MLEPTNWSTFIERPLVATKANEGLGWHLGTLVPSVFEGIILTFKLAQVQAAQMNAMVWHVMPPQCTFCVHSSINTFYEPVELNKVTFCHSIQTFINESSCTLGGVLFVNIQHGQRSWGSTGSH